ncbi:restriction endonuclease subunit S [Kistimonas asteriae]|uniref:restriction endonuclease subunit S n=1 Tax=Kistimonas asteriae TaxID=517724 RepID=UPI001BA9915B|nr:restriction endonuclease subunit S [Kistimonas asteriae]
MSDLAEGYKYSQIGPVPETWEVCRLSDCAVIDKQSLSNSTPADFSFEYISLGDVEKGRIVNELPKMTFSESPSRARKSVSSGDILLATVRPNLKNFIRIKSVDSPLVASTGYSVISANDDNDGEFLYQSIYSDHVTDQIESLVVGSNYPAINSSDVKNLLITCPPLPEQKKIASILSAVDNKLDLIARKITATRTLKKGLMQRLFSQGVGTRNADGHWQPHTEFKDSELGRIPAGWEIKPLGDFLSLITYGFTNPMPTADEGILMVTAANINNGRIDTANARRTTEEAFCNLLTDKSRPIQGDILLTKDGSLGRLALVDSEKLCINQSVALLRPKQNVETQFLKLLLESPTYQRKMLDDAGGSTIKHIYITKVDKMLIACPLIEEQVKIVGILSTMNRKLDQAIAKKSQLQILKKGLMQKLLTGQLRVKV